MNINVILYESNQRIIYKYQITIRKVYYNYDSNLSTSFGALNNSVTEDLESFTYSTYLIHLVY